jgi:hypothetical protein
MFKVELIDSSALVRGLEDTIRSEVKLLADSLFTEVKKKTPVDTGTARAGWRKKIQNTGFELNNAVPYVPVLDKGRHMTNKGYRGSKQAPNGIVGPSLESIKRKN